MVGVGLKQRGQSRCMPASKPRTRHTVHRVMHLLHRPCARALQVVDELFAYWTLEESEDTLEALEDALIVRPAPACPVHVSLGHMLARQSPGCRDAAC